MASTDVDEKVCLRRFGLNFDPPSLVLEYERPGSGRLFHRRIGLRRLGPQSDPSRTAEKIRRQNKALLAEDQVPFEQLVSVVARLQARQNADKAISSPNSAGSPHSATSPKVSPEAAAAITIAVEAAVPTAQAVDSPKSAISSKSATSLKSATSPKSVISSPKSASAAAAAPAAEEAPIAAADADAVEFADAPDLPSIEPDLDLNKLSNEELDRYKAKMDVEFYRNLAKPGDPGFEYDVRMDHVVDDDADSCGWDESGSDGD